MKKHQFKIVKKVSENTIVVDKEQFVKVLLYKLKMVLKRSAFSFYHSIKFADPLVTITINTLEDDINYTVDYSIPVKKNIFNIKNILMEYYPKFKFKNIKERKATGDEIEDLINNGMSVDEALVYNIQEEKIFTYLINRVLIDKNEIFIYCFELDKEFRYRMKNSFPITLFLTKIKNKDYENLFELGNIFFENSIFLDSIISSDEVMKNKLNKF